MYNMIRKVVLNKNYILTRFLDIFITRIVNLTGIVQLKVVQYFGLGRRVSKGTPGAKFKQFIILMIFHLT